MIKALVGIQPSKRNGGVKKRIYKCSTCHKEFTKLFCLHRHRRTIHSRDIKSQLTCRYCHVTCVSFEELQWHLGIFHSGNKPHSCRECGATFKGARKLVRHKIRVHQIGPEDFCCLFCQMLFDSRWNLNRHLQRCHTGEKPFWCGMCGLEFAGKDGRDAHQKHCKKKIKSCGNGGIGVNQPRRKYSRKGHNEAKVGPLPTVWLTAFDRGLKPEKVLGAMKSSSGELQFIIKWQGVEEADVVPASVANFKCPQIVIQFYEDRFAWEKEEK